MSKSPDDTFLRSLPLALLRFVIGWHFLYEGCTKLIFPGWTAAGYLQGSSGPFSAIFNWLGSNKALIGVIDQLNIWGLIGIGLALILGVFIRPACWSGMALLGLYYVAYPPLFSPATAGATEGSYLIVNKNIVELFALSVIIAYPAAQFSIAAWWARRKQSVAAAEKTRAELAAERRELMASLAGLPVLGAFVMAVLRKHGWRSFEETNLTSRAKRVDTFVSSPTLKNFQFASRSDLKVQLPYAKIKNLDLSRMILGGNLIGGWAHARDLVYVSKLVKAYHHREKIFQTLALSESCGVNAIITNPQLCNAINDYWRAGGRIHFISDCGGKDLMAMVRKSIDNGASACYIQGAMADQLVQEGKFDLMHEALELIHKNGLPAGIGGHKLQTIQASVDKGLKPDFWMKTLHQNSYWSARPGEKECDNIWCDSPPDTIAYMKTLPQPWIAFKTLAAGALMPKESFRFAFESGADFICVGMYDFQIVEDVNIAGEVLRGPIVRDRLWRA